MCVITIDVKKEASKVESKERCVGSFRGRKEKTEM